MRALCFVAATVGVAAAFVPGSVSSSSRISYGQHRNIDCAASPRPTSRAAAAPTAPTAEVQAQAQAGEVDGSAGNLGVIVCDHGSRRENANAMLFEVAERYRSFSGFDIVEAAHMELAEPSIDQAFDRCVAAGASKVVLHPFFLSPGRHVTSDIPALMTAAAKRHPEVAWVVSEPLGLQELMPRVMHAAVSESVAGEAWRHG
ncbi:unnamed protein product, partial [Hapterophycus canaliculatus]